MRDIHQLRKSGRATALFGVVFTLLLLATGGFVVADFSGAFSRSSRFTVMLPSNGSVVALQSPVRYRDVTIGKVVSVPTVGAGQAPEVGVQIDKKYLDKLADGTTAKVGPVSIFGNQNIQLVPPTGAAGSSALRSGAVIPAFDDSEVSLQTTFVSLDGLLSQINPTKLNAGLSGLSSALDGQGKSLGTTMLDLNKYLRTMLPLWPTFLDDLDKVSILAASLTDNTPDFLSLVRNATTSSNTLVANADAYRALLTNGGSLANQVATLLAQTSASYADTINGAVPLLKSLSQGPDLISRMLTGIDRWSRAWAPALASGVPAVRLDPLRVRNPADLALAIVAGGRNQVALMNSGVHPGFANPPTYSSCPKTLCATSRRSAAPAAQVGGTSDSLLALGLVPLLLERTTTVEGSHR